MENSKKETIAGKNVRKALIERYGSSKKEERNCSYCDVLQPVDGRCTRCGRPVEERESVADAINEALTKPIWAGETEKEISHRNKGVVSDLLEIQRNINKVNSDFMDSARYAGTFPVEPYVPPSIWVRLWEKIQWPLGLRIVHKDDICNCEEY